MKPGSALNADTGFFHLVAEIAHPRRSLETQEHRLQHGSATPTFFVFKYHDGFTGDVMGYLSANPNVTMNNSHILIAAKGLTLDSTTNAVSPANSTFFTVLDNPLKTDTSVQQWELF